MIIIYIRYLPSFCHRSTQLSIHSNAPNKIEPENPLRIHHYGLPNGCKKIKKRCNGSVSDNPLLLTTRFLPKYTLLITKYTALRTLSHPYIYTARNYTIVGTLSRTHVYTARYDTALLHWECTHIYTASHHTAMLAPPRSNIYNACNYNVLHLSH